MTTDPDREPLGTGASRSTAQAREIAALTALARGSRRIVALTGAGISTESGIPDYRGPGGVWERQTLPTLGDFLDNPETRRTYWANRRERYPALAAARPNAGHLALAALDRAGLLACVITQNIDGLHQAAGNAPDRVIELHGTAHRVRCLQCSSTWDAWTIHRRLEAGEEVPACEECGGPLRAATVLFGQPLPRAALERSVAAVRSCDVLLVIGSSLIVNPAAQLPMLAKRSGARLAIINRTPTPLDALADVRVLGEAGPTLTAFANALLSGAAPGSPLLERR